MDKESEDLVVTVGDLIDALEQYDPDTMLAEDYLVVLYNSGKKAKELGMKPCIGIKEL